MTADPAHPSPELRGADAAASDRGDAASEARQPETVLVDWEQAGHRLLVSAKWLLAAAVVAWVVVSVVAGQWRGAMLGNFVGLALVGMFLVEIWVVGGSALAGMLRAGEGGHRLSSMDVGLLPPQLRRGGSITPPLAETLGARGDDDEVGMDGDDPAVAEPGNASVAHDDESP